METVDNKRLRECLVDDAEFKSLTEFFLEKHLSEAEEPNSDFDKFYKAFVPSLAIEFAQATEGSESPIEKIFLRSLLLSSLKRGILELLPRPIFRDAERELIEFVEYLAKLKKFMQGAADATGSTSAALKYWDEEHNKGAMSDVDYGQLNGDFIKYEVLRLQSSFHFALQPSFRNFTEDGKTVRPDLLFWIPAKADLRVVVECDGFAYHSSKKNFVNDRKRDRMFIGKGYRVLRFSGTEIFQDPPAAATELFRCLEEIRSREFPRPLPE
jgi:hypothetical protein